jgi:hypothetical protein
MADPNTPHEQPKTKWIWVALIVVLAFLVVAVLFNPSGERDGTVQDPIVIEDMGDGTGVGENLDADQNTAPPPEPFAPGGRPSN